MNPVQAMDNAVVAMMKLGQSPPLGTTRLPGEPSAFPCFVPNFLNFAPPSMSPNPTIGPFQGFFASNNPGAAHLTQTLSMSMNQIQYPSTYGHGFKVQLQHLAPSVLLRQVPVATSSSAFVPVPPRNMHERLQPIAAPFQKDIRTVWEQQAAAVNSRKRQMSVQSSSTEDADSVLSSELSSESLSPSVTPAHLMDKPSMSPSKRPRRVEHVMSSLPRVGLLMREYKSPRQTKHGLGGERRLNINFLNTGKHLDPPQTFGKYGLVIPDGICGTHTMYAQHWKFEITHHAGKSGEVLLKWSIVNLSSGGSTAMMETTEQAFQRQTKGNTICNIVVREALNRRAQELEDEIKANQRINNHTRVANLSSLVKELRPKQCTEGLLFFGLRHEAVQVKAAAALRAY